MSNNIEIKTLPVRFMKVPRMANAFLLKGECNILVDTGPKQSPTDGYLFQELRKIDVEPGSVKAVLYTHGHQDHVGGTNVMQELGAEIYISEPDAVFLTDHAKTFVIDLLLLAKAKGVDLAAAEAEFLDTMPDEITELKTVAPGDVLEFGDVKLSVVDMSGHSYGSVGFYLEQEDALFGGDAVCGTGPRKGCMPLIYSLDGYIDTVNRVRQLGIGRLIMAHNFFSPGFEPSYSISGDSLPAYLATSVEMAERLRDEASKFAGRQSEPFIGVCDRILKTMPEKFGYQPIGEQEMADMTLRTMVFALRDYANWQF